MSLPEAGFYVVVDFPCGERSELFTAERCASNSPASLGGFSEQDPSPRGLCRIAGDLCNDVSLRRRDVSARPY
jgi:hypothetical protein